MLTDQMTPAKLRKTGQSLRDAAGVEIAAMPINDRIQLVDAGANALNRLADVIEHAEKWEDRPPSSPYAMGLRDAWRTILRLARRETHEEEAR